MITLDSVFLKVFIASSGSPFAIDAKCVSSSLKSQNLHFLDTSPSMRIEMLVQPSWWNSSRRNPNPTPAPMALTNASLRHQYL
uniref:Uncharacterized protein n=1 Tax=Zea mays TaxID=4577 RepID=C0P318_MAIZE|nr:unknown [Zea mays]|eukprot:XP_023158156.1 uncharacterized protein LOC111591365 [Zea mays]